MDKITVIIPVYNGEEFISDSIESVINQTFNNWELIVVDDCSTDNTVSIIKNYVNKFPNKIKLIKLDKNGGVGKARQVAINQTDTKYLTFLDSDDTLEPDFLDINLQLAKQHDSDIVYTSFGIVYEVETVGLLGVKYKKKVKQIIPSGDYILSGEATPQLHYWAEKKFLTGKLFKTSLVKSIKFSDKRVGEDVQTLFFLTYLADRVRSSSYSGYNHNFREGSLLANAPYFLCYCGSTEAEIEMIEFLFDKKDYKQLKYVGTITYNNFLQINNLIKTNQIPKEDLEKHKEQYNRIQEWFKTHKEILDIILS